MKALNHLALVPIVLAVANPAAFASEATPTDNVSAFLSRILICEADAQAMSKMIDSIAEAMNLSEDEITEAKDAMAEVPVDPKAPQIIEIFDQAVDSDGNGMMMIEFTRRPEGREDWPSSKAAFPATIKQSDDGTTEVKSLVGFMEFSTKLYDIKAPGVGLLFFKLAGDESEPERTTLYSCKFTPVY